MAIRLVDKRIFILLDSVETAPIAAVLINWNVDVAFPSTVDMLDCNDCTDEFNSYSNVDLRVDSPLLKEETVLALSVDVNPSAALNVDRSPWRMAVLRVEATPLIVLGYVSVIALLFATVNAKSVVSARREEAVVAFRTLVETHKSDWFKNKVDMVDPTFVEIVLIFT